MTTTIDLIWSALISEWQTFCLLFVCGGLFVFLKSERPSWHALAGIACYAITVALMSLWRLVDSSTEEGLYTAYEVWASGIHGSLIVYLAAFMAFLIWPPRRNDALVYLIWLVVFIAEVWTGLAENINCNFWATDIPRELQTEAQKNMSVCERIYGWWYSYVPLALQIGLMGYFVSRWSAAKRLIST